MIIKLISLFLLFVMAMPLQADLKSLIDKNNSVKDDVDSGNSTIVDSSNVVTGDISVIARKKETIIPQALIESILVNGNKDHGIFYVDDDSREIKLNGVFYTHETCLEMIDAHVLKESSEGKRPPIIGMGFYVKNGNVDKFMDCLEENSDAENRKFLTISNFPPEVERDSEVDYTLTYADTCSESIRPSKYWQVNREDGLCVTYHRLKGNPGVLSDAKYLSHEWETLCENGQYLPLIDSMVSEGQLDGMADVFGIMIKGFKEGLEEEIDLLMELDEETIADYDETKLENLIEEINEDLLDSIDKIIDDMKRNNNNYEFLADLAKELEKLVDIRYSIILKQLQLAGKFNLIKDVGFAKQRIEGIVNVLKDIDDNDSPRVVANRISLTRRKIASKMKAYDRAQPHLREKWRVTNGYELGLSRGYERRARHYARQREYVMQDFQEDQRDLLKPCRNNGLNMRRNSHRCEENIRELRYLQNRANDEYRWLGSMSNRYQNMSQQYGQWEMQGYDARAKRMGYEDYRDYQFQKRFEETNFDYGFENEFMLSDPMSMSRNMNSNNYSFGNPSLMGDNYNYGMTTPGMNSMPMAPNSVNPFGVQQGRYPGMLNPNVQQHPLMQ